jgi:hypothetical protein
VALVPLPPSGSSPHIGGRVSVIQQALTTSSNRTAIALFDALVLGATLV